MKDLFPEYTPKTDEEYQKIWDDALICFDTSFLTDLYRLSESSRNEFLDLMEKLKDRIWLPYHVALEYNRNRYGVILDQIYSLKNTISDVKESKEALLESLNKTYKRYALRDSLKKVIDSSFDKILKEIQNIQPPYDKLKKEDIIFERLCKLFDKKITKSFTVEELEEIYKEGEERYKKKTPPGYMDNKKEGNEIYGDLVVWKHILKKAKDEKKPIILATGDEKKDWIWYVRKEKRGARHELTREMINDTGQDFLLYTTDFFYKYGRKMIGEKVTDKVVEEIKSIQEKPIRQTIFRKYIDDELKEDKESLQKGELFNTYNYYTPHEVILKISQLKDEINNIENSNTIFTTNLDKFLNNSRIQDKKNQIKNLQNRWYELMKKPLENKGSKEDNLDDIYPEE